MPGVFLDFLAHCDLAAAAFAVVPELFPLDELLIDEVFFSKAAAFLEARH